MKRNYKNKIQSVGTTPELPRSSVAPDFHLGGYYLGSSGMRGVLTIFLLFSVSGLAIALWNQYETRGLFLPPAFTFFTVLCLFGLLYKPATVLVLKVLVYSVIPIGTYFTFTGGASAYIYAPLATILPLLLLRQYEGWFLSLMAALSPLIIALRPDFELPYMNKVILTNLAVCATFGYVMFRFRAIYAESALHANEAERANAAKSAFLSNFSHEIRTPLNGIFGSLQVIRSQPNDSELVARYTNVAMQSYHSVVGIVNDILDLSKLAQDKVELYPEPARVCELIEVIKSEIGAVASSKGLKLDVSCPDELRDTNRLIDRTRLAQILRNLLSNAVKFTETGSIVLEARVGDQPDQVVFSVSDTGVGIPAAKLDKIFEPFEQSDSSRSTERSGTGLGLAIVKRLTELMGGTVNVTSELGGGSCFEINVLLPITELQGADQQASQDLSTLLPARILLAEDVLTNRMIFGALLKDLPYIIDEAENGQIAVEKALSNEYDMVFLDIQMPIMDGLSALRALKIANYPHPIFACTANVMKDDVVEYMDAGFDSVIGKPYLKEDLIANIQAVVARKTFYNAGS